jgi:hypothetical protein
MVNMEDMGGRVSLYPETSVSDRSDDVSPESKSKLGLNAVRVETW